MIPPLSNFVCIIIAYFERQKKDTEQEFLLGVSDYADKKRRRERFRSRRLDLVRLTGVEPVRPFGHKHLKLASLPIPAQPQISTKLQHIILVWRRVVNCFFLIYPALSATWSNDPKPVADPLLNFNPATIDPYYEQTKIPGG